MKQQEIKLGQATYEICRVYAGSRSISELVAEQLVRTLPENPTFDGEAENAV